MHNQPNTILLGTFMGLQSVPPSTRQPPKTTSPPNLSTLFPQEMREAWPLPGPRNPEGPCPPRIRRVCPPQPTRNPGLSTAHPLGGRRLPQPWARKLPGLFPSGGRPAAGSTYIPVPPGRRRLSGALPAGGARPRPAEQRHRGRRKGRERRRRRDWFCSARPEGRGGARPPPPASPAASSSSSLFLTE